MFFDKLRIKSQGKPPDNIKKHSGEQSRTIDLHTHTYYSDGALSPTQLVKKAKEIGLAAIAIADHDSVDGLDEGLNAGKKLGVDVLPAIEITSYPDPETEFHLLGLFIDHKNKKLNRELDKSQEEREKRAKKVIANLNGLGYNIEFGDLRSIARGTIVQPHIAWLVINDMENKEKLAHDFGGRPTTGDFIRKYLIPGAPAYEARPTVVPKEAIDLIHTAGGLAFIAHPCWNLAKKEDEKIIFDDRSLDDLIKKGLDGIEVYAHRESEGDTRVCVEHYKKIAEKENLAISGGSDYHGFGSAGKDLGFSDFYLKVPYKILEDLKLRTGRKHF
ncbi:MAG TPA: PHP domain-containing protein [Candidatus Nanoarchaeia archaeon]